MLIKDMEKSRKYRRNHYQKHKEELLAYAKKYRQEHKRLYSDASQKSAVKIKIDVLTHYGNGKLACIWCNESRLPCLSLDHINNDGYKEKVKGQTFYRYLKREGYPEGYQTLCWNCQVIKKAAFSNEQRLLRTSGTGTEQECISL